VHEQEYAIVSALVPVAWADGVFADKEKEMLDALLDAYGASEEQKILLRDYAKEKRTLNDIRLQDLSAGDRRVLLQHAVLLTFADGQQDPSEAAFLRDLAEYLRIPPNEANSVVANAEARVRKHLNLLD
jgi:uncharacterized tellurite resistance protein B-like protein